MAEMHDDGKWIAYVNTVDRCKGAALRGDQAAVDHAAHGPRNIVGRHQLTVVKAYAIAQMEGPCQRIGPLPACGQPGLQVEVFVLANERVVDGRANALGLSVGALTEVEVVG